MSAAAPGASKLRPDLVGRCFVGPLFDYALIGGGLSLVVVAILLWVPGGQSLTTLETLPYFLLAGNATHFAASTVRLYTKPGATREWPILTLVFPLITLAVLTWTIADAERLGRHLHSLYLTWSPYHYAAQAFGLAAMYAARSGSALSPAHRRLVRWTCLAPFVFTFVAGYGSGLQWLAPSLYLDPHFDAARAVIQPALIGISFVAPFAVFGWIWRASGRPLPLISLLLVLSNAVWWLILVEPAAFAWATIFHAVQYIAIVILFHVRDHAGDGHGTAYHAIRFYLMSFVLAYALFHLVPRGYALAGFGFAESAILVIAAINVHHFIVDGFIWRLRKPDVRRTADV